MIRLSNKIFLRVYVLVLLTFLFCTTTHAKNKSTQQSEDKRIKFSEKKNKKINKKEPRIKFDFEEKNLGKIIEKFAAKKEINIILPQGNDSIKQTVTFKKKKPITLSEAEKYLETILDIAGYSMRPNDGFFVVTKTTPINFAREPLPLYVNVPPKKLPTEKRIRAIYYLANLRVPEEGRSSEPIALILKDIIGSDKGFMFDVKSNGIILTGLSDSIASAMTIILELDKSGERDVVEVLTLFNSSAETIAKMLKDQIIATTLGDRRRKKTTRKREGGFYFSPNTIVTADPRTNSVILMGRESAVARIREFIREELDKPPEEGISILHVYDLQYLKAKEFSDVLNRVVAKSVTGQAEREFGGAHRFFEDVVIVAEEERRVETKAVGAEAYAAQSKATIGGNRLVIAAKNDDWKRIKTIIEEADRPDNLSIIDMLIVDVTYDVDKLLQAQTRNPLSLLREGVEFQSAHMHNQILDADNPKDSTTLASDLLRLIGNEHSIAVPETSKENIGSTIISLKDPCNEGIWSVIKVLDKYVEKKVIAHPFIITKSGVEAHANQTSIRRNAGQREISTSGTTTILEEDFKAVIKITTTPRISSLDRLSLQITIEIEDFIDETETPETYRRTTRKIETNANITSGQILVIGGLTKTRNSQNKTSSPLLEKIPLLGNLFRGRVKEKEKSNLMVFIHPTVVDPKLRAGLKVHAKDKIELAYNKIHEGELFEDIKDPITNFFFGKRDIGETEAVLNEFLVETEYTSGKKYFDAPPGRATKLESPGTEKIKALFAHEKNPFAKESATVKAA